MFGQWRSTRIAGRLFLVGMRTSCWSSVWALRVRRSGSGVYLGSANRPPPVRNFTRAYAAEMLSAKTPWRVIICELTLHHTSAHFWIMYIMPNIRCALLALLCNWTSPASSFVPRKMRDLLHRGAVSIEAEGQLLRRNKVVVNRRAQYAMLPKPRQITSLSSEDGDNQDGAELPIDKFRFLMGNLYGVAGLAHAADCYFGDSQLLAAAGSPPVQDLPMAGQSLVALWCAAGPIAFGASRVGGVAADIGLLFYGAVEVAGAAILESELSNLGGAAAEIDPLTNSVAVQGIVLASWLYSKNKQE